MAKRPERGKKMVINQNVRGRKAGDEVVVDDVRDGLIFGSRADVVDVRTGKKIKNLWDDQLSPTEDKKGKKR